MKIEIENYRGWDIYFDTDKETFYAQSDEADFGASKKSFSSAKKFVDDFIKENSTFKPVWIEGIDSWSMGKKIQLIGIRKDGRFVYEQDGEKKQLSEYDERHYGIVQESNAEIFQAIKEYDGKIENLRKERDQLTAKIVRVDLSELRKKYMV